MKRLLAGIVLALTIAGNAFNQDITQVVRGKVVDEVSQMPLPFTAIVVLTLDPVLGTTSDDNGYFRLDKVPVGRHNIQVSFMGYESKVIPELLVTSGKEIVLDIGLIEKVEMMDEVVVKAYTQKDKPLRRHRGTPADLMILRVWLPRLRVWPLDILMTMQLSFAAMHPKDYSGDWRGLRSPILTILQI